MIIIKICKRIIKNEVNFKKIYYGYLIKIKILNWENINDFLIGNGSKNKLGNF